VILILMLCICCGAQKHGKDKKASRRAISTLESQRHSMQLHVEEQMEKIESLNQALQDKKHTEEELEIMRMSLNTIDKERKNELREVMVDSKDVETEGMLGKGGFGVVYKGTYTQEIETVITKEENGVTTEESTTHVEITPVAVKELLQINEETVGRFR
jgi:hypothetical protein